MTAYYTAARRAVIAAEAAAREVEDDAIAVYERRAEARRALRVARDALAIATLYPEGDLPLVVGQPVEGRDGYGPGVIVEVYLASRRVGVHASRDDLTATVKTDTGALYAVKAARP